MMIVPMISNDAASIAWNSMAESGAFDASLLVVDFIGDQTQEKLGDLELEELVDDLRLIQEKFKKRYPNGLPKAVGGEVDSRIVKPIHKHLSAVTHVDQLARIGFWRWLSNVAYSGFFWKFIEWRFQDRMQINWGITSGSRLVEVYFYRAWLRGHFMFEPKLSDPYHYAQKGASDVWRSHIFRQEFGRDRNFVKAFLDVLVDDKGKSKVSSQSLRQEVIPAVRAWTSNATFSHLSYPECKELIEKLINEGI